MGPAVCRTAFPQEWLAKHPFLWSYFPISATMNPPERTRRQYEALTSWEGCYARLGRIASRTLVISGDADVVVPPGNSLMLANGIPSSRLVCTPTAGMG